MVARFFQEPPELGNQWDDDALLREYLGYTCLLYTSDAADE